MARIVIEFSREKDTHTIALEEVTTKEMVLAYQSLRETIEKKVRLPMDRIEFLMYKQDQEEKDDGKDD
jgi:histidinol dehydrogenase